MFKITGAATALHFPLDKFTLPAGDSHHKTVPPRVLQRLKNMAATKQITLVEEPEAVEKKTVAPTASEPREPRAPSGSSSGGSSSSGGGKSKG